MMKIASSSVSMRSSHAYESQVSEQRATLNVRAEEGARAMDSIAVLHRSSSQTLVSAVNEYRQQEETAQAEKQQQLEALSPLQALQEPSQPAFELPEDQLEDLKIQLLRKMLEALHGKSRLDPLSMQELKHGGVLDLRGQASRVADLKFQLFAGEEGLPPAPGTSAAGTLWQRVNAVSGSWSEHEETAFQSSGYVVTEDGRSISIDVAFSMSRSHSEEYDFLSSETYLLTDPLIINLEGKTTSVSDEKFQFDLDGDGTEEEISFAGEGSGFLALDKNGNGTIDDGSELFGTQSGSGFADLAAYDEDGNHWIDENDAIFSQLKVWTRDAQGNDRLLDLKEADVGAIYLGSADTEFSLKDGANQTQAVIRKSGVYLKESGGTGTLSHVDLRC